MESIGPVSDHQLPSVLLSRYPVASVSLAQQSIAQKLHLRFLDVRVYMERGGVGGESTVQARTGLTVQLLTNKVAFLFFKNLSRFFLLFFLGGTSQMIWMRI